MDPIHNARDFTAAIRVFMEREGMSITQVAAHMKKGRGAIEHYLYSPPERADFRRKVVERYPEIFRETGDPMATQVAPESPVGRDMFPQAVNDNVAALYAKIEQSRSLVAALSAQLTWFLYEATEQERNVFRDALGGNWEHFQQLVRAMHGETAFSIAKDEGRL